MRRLKLASSITQGLRETLIRFPLPLCAAAVVTFYLILLVDAKGDFEPYGRIALLAGLDFVAILLLDLVLESFRPNTLRRVLGSTAVILSVVAYGAFIMPEVLEDARPPFWYSHFILLFCLHLGIALVPLRSNRDHQVLWRFNLQLFLRYFFSSVNAALLFGGLALALVSSDKLFGLDLDDKIYSQLWFFCAFFAHPLLFLGGIPRLSELSESSEFPKPLHFSLRFIALPLVGLYLVILYAYVGKILLLWSWPNGWVAMPIFILAVIGLLTYVLSVPLAEAQAWARLYHRWLSRLLFPLSIVLFLALQVRLSDYGMTINRYLGLVLAIWLFGLSLAYIIRPRLQVGWIPITLLGVSLFAIYSGPVGAFSWSERAQVNRVLTLATEAGALHDGQLAPARNTPDNETIKQLRSSLRYVFENFGSAPLDASLVDFYESTQSKDFADARPYSQAVKLLGYLELKYTDADSHVYYRYSGALPTFSHPWTLNNIYLSPNSTRTIESDHGPWKIQFEQTGQLQVWLEDVQLAETDTSEWAKRILKAVQINGQDQPAPLAWDFGNDDWRFSAVLITASIDPTDDNSIRHLNAALFYTPPATSDPE
jgi:hypothetical protein